MFKLYAFGVLLDGSVGKKEKYCRLSNVRRDEINDIKLVNYR